MSLSHGQYQISRQNLALYYDFVNVDQKIYSQPAATNPPLIYDLSGNGRHGTIPTSPTGLVKNTSSVPVKSATVTANAANSCNILASSYNYSNITALSYDMWIRTSTTQHTTILAHNRGNSSSGTTGRSVTMLLTPGLGSGGTYGTTQVGRVMMGIDSDNIAAFGFTDLAVNDGIWHHIVGVYSRASGSVLFSDFQVYIDGQARTMTAGSGGIGTATAPLTGLGGMQFFYHYSWQVGYTGNAGTYQGDVGSIRVYERALSAQEILQTWTLERSKFGR